MNFSTRFNFAEKWRLSVDEEACVGADGVVPGAVQEAGAVDGAEEEEVHEEAQGAMIL